MKIKDGCKEYGGLQNDRHINLCDCFNVSSAMLFSKEIYFHHYVEIIFSKLLGRYFHTLYLSNEIYSLFTILSNQQIFHPFFIIYCRGL